MSLVGANNEQKIWNFLKGKGLSDHGAAGLMGNLFAESGLIPTNLQNSYEKSLGYTDASYTEAVDRGLYGGFVEDKAGYGLAQWTYWSRKKALLEYARKSGRSIGDLEMQLGFLMQELTSYGLMSALKAAASVREASDLILLKFEKPAGMNSEATQSKRAGYGQTYYDRYAKKGSVAIMGGKITTGKQLAEAALNVAKNYKTLYVMGCFGAPMTFANKKRYTENNPYNTAADRTRMINAATADTFGFDCVCLIKGLLWGWSGDASKQYGGAGYAINGVPDLGADTMITKCSGVSTDFSKIEVGEAVWMKGHIGIYIGDGLAVECTPKWANCVQVTACNCSKSGYNRRNWTKHGKLPYVTYTGQSENVGAATKPTTPSTKPSTGTQQEPASGLAHKVGDIVDFTGTTHYANSNASTGPACKPGKAKVTQVSKTGKHPYHLVAVSGGGSTVYGWVNVSDIGAGGKEYTVVRGDSLWGIAQKHLGAGNRYPEIMALNGLKSTTIHPGQKLRLPS